MGQREQALAEWMGIAGFVRAMHDEKRHRDARDALIRMETDRASKG